MRFQVSRATPRAVEVVTKTGGEVETLYLNKLGMRAYLKPEKFALLPARASIPYKLQHNYPFETHGHLYTPYRLKGKEVDPLTGQLKAGTEEQVLLARGEEFSKWLAARTAEDLAPPPGWQPREKQLNDVDDRSGRQNLRTRAAHRRWLERRP